jgi:hypothetical protein
MKRKQEHPDPEENTYELVKQRHERRCFGLRTFPTSFVYDKHPPQILSRATVKTSFETLRYADEDGLCCPFIPAWFADPDMRVVDRVAVSPCVGEGEEEVFNLWRPLRASQLPEVEDVADLTQPIEDYLQHQVGIGKTEWILNYLAWIVQRPSMRTEMALVFHGEGDNGLLFEFFCDKVVGGHGALQTSHQPVSDADAVHRVCVFLDEIGRLERKTGDLIVRKTLWFSRTVEVDNLVNLLITSKDPLPEESMHLAQFEVHGTTDPEGALRAHLERPEVARAFYQRLLCRPLGGSHRKWLRHTYPR